MDEWSEWRIERSALRAERDRRYGTAEEQIEQADELVRCLMQYYECSAPDYEETVSIPPEHVAREALHEASNLISAVSRWAIENILGLSLLGLKVLPSQMPKVRNSPEYLAWRDVANRPDLEEAGATLRDPVELTALQKRTILRNYIYCNSGGLPEWLAREFVDALDGLDAGDPSPIFKAAKVSAKVGMREARAKLRLLQFIRFRAKAYGEGIEKQTEFVVKTCNLGVGERAIEGWPRSLKAKLSPLEVESRIEHAENCASFVKYANDRENAGFTLSDREIARRDLHANWFGIDELKKAGAEFLAALQEN